MYFKMFDGLFEPLEDLWQAVDQKRKTICDKQKIISDVLKRSRLSFLYFLFDKKTF